MFGERLRRLRQGGGYTLRELAKATGYSFPYLSELERGVKSPSREVVEKLTSVLGAGRELRWAACMGEMDRAGRKWLVPSEVDSWKETRWPFFNLVLHGTRND